MPTVKSLDDLKRLREEALEKRKMKTTDGKAQIIVGMGTCGIAAGARDTMKAILDYIESENLTGIIVTQVALPDEPAQPLWLIATRPGQGRTPWYLLTSDPILSTDDAWRTVFAYARRWQIEMSFRFSKSELAFESPRLLQWEHRKKLLLIASLAYAFLLSLIQFDHDALFDRIIDVFCARNGKWSREVSSPLYRLRLAISRLWLAYRPSYLPFLNSG